MKKVLPPKAILIPDNAKVAFDGVLFQVYVWPQKMFDGTTEQFEMIRRKDTVQIMGIKDDKIVMVKDAQPGRAVRTHFPGGRADAKDPDWLAAAKREMREETGLEFANWRLIRVTQPWSKAEWFVPWFVAWDVSHEGEQDVDTSGEQIDVELWTMEKLKEEVFVKEDPTLAYSIPFLMNAETIDDILNIPEFKGQEVER